MDTIRLWPRSAVINPEIAEQKPYHYTAANVLRKHVPKNWHQYIPAINIKLRPRAAPADAVVYCWGGLIARGKFIVELDNPYCLTAYNIGAFRLYKYILRKILLSDRCLQIRCISRACHDTLRIELGEDVGAKASVFYPLLTDVDAAHTPAPPQNPLKLLYISTRFESKGGPSVLKISERLLAARIPHALTLVTYLPDEFAAAAKAMPQVNYVRANLNRAQLIDLYKSHDIFVLPTFDESFGMVVYEAIAHGIAVIANDVYAIREMVLPGHNGQLVTPPLANWCSMMPTKYAADEGALKSDLRKTDLGAMEDKYVSAIVDLAQNYEKLFDYKKFSQAHFKILTAQPDYFSIPGRA